MARMGKNNFFIRLYPPVLRSLTEGGSNPNLFPCAVNWDLVVIGRIPRSVLAIPEMGDGRQTRILDLMQSCSFSTHDLSRAGMPVGFNMLFEK